MKASLSISEIRHHNILLIGENAVLLLILGILVLRSVFLEVTYPAPPNPSLLLPPPVLSLLLSFLLIAVFSLWQASRLFRPPPQSLCGRLILWASIFILLGLLSALNASNKRDALTELTTLAAPLLIAGMSAELFRKPDRILLFLWVLAALGITAVYQCREQALTDNEAVLQNYEQNPQKVLDELGIEPGTLQHWQFEHRLHSKDIRGFLTTSNSTGSFLLLSLFGCLGLLVYAFRNSPSQNRSVQIVLYFSAAVIVGYGLLLCRSRGALTAGSFCLAGWAVCVWQGKRLWPYRKILAALGLLSAAAIIAAAAAYGIRHGRLPGPNAMLVRWQYWVSTVQMIADHPLLGVGGGNFSIWYPFYKIPAAPELIRDPHNFFLSLAAQYGLPAALVFTVILLLPLRTALQSESFQPEYPKAEGPSTPSGLLLLAVCAVMLLLIRPWISERPTAETDPLANGAFYIVAYLAPAGVMLLALGLFVLAGREPTDWQMLREALLPALGWAVLAVLIHNLIDFAIFETAVLTALALCLGTLWAFVCPRRPCRPIAPSFRWIAMFCLFAVFAGFSYFIVFLPFRAGLAIQQAFRRPAESIHLLRLAEEKDPLSPQPAWYLGQMLLQQAQQKRNVDKTLFEEAEKAFKRALTRNPDDYRLMEALGDLFITRAETEDSDIVRQEFLKAGFCWFQKAWRRFPGCDRLAYKLGMTAEQMNQIEEAVRWYSLAVEIEEAYRKQFEQMYPNYPRFSRLGEKRYQYARDFLESRTENRLKKETNSLSP
jgi:O-antigen ligase